MNLPPHFDSMKRLRLGLVSGGRGPQVVDWHEIGARGSNEGWMLAGRRITTFDTGSKRLAKFAHTEMSLTQPCFVKVNEQARTA